MSLEETAVSLEQLTATVARNTESAVQASQRARQSEAATTRGRDVVKQVHATMEAISMRHEGASAPPAHHAPPRRSRESVEAPVARAA